MLIDSDVIIWNWRGQSKAAELLEQKKPFSISAMTYMELVQGVRDKREWSSLQKDLRLWQVTILPITEAVSVRAMQLVEQYALSHHLLAGDAIIAATALEHQFPLITSNIKHFQVIQGLSLQPFILD